MFFHINSSLLPGGFTGVDMFFVISGFLISSIIIKGKANANISLFDFYAGRVRRIVPAYFVMLGVVTAVCFPLFVHSPDFADFRRSLIAAGYFNSAHYFGKLGGYFAQASYELPLQHTWTLAIEMQFYLLLPIALIWIPQRVNKIIIPIVFLGLVAWSEFSLRGSNDVSRSIYFSLPARIPEFLVGVMLAIFQIGHHWNEKIKGVLSIIGMLLIAASLLVINHATRFPGIWSLLPTIGTALLIASRGGVFGPMLVCLPMVWLGDISYSLYLWHWPVLAIARYVRMDYALPLSWLFILVPVIFCLSIASFRFVERPLRRLSDRSLFAFVTGSIVIAVVMIVPLKAMHLKFTTEVTPHYLPFMTDGIYGYKFAYDNSCFSSIKNDCLWGDDASKEPRMLILGDSHAAQLAKFIEVYASERHLGYRLIASSDCPTIPGIDRRLFHREWDKNCNAQTEFAKKYIAESNPIIIAASWEGYSNKTIEQVRGFIEGLPSGKHVIILFQIPTLKIDPMRQIHFTDVGIPNFLYPHGADAVTTAAEKTNDRVRHVLGEGKSYKFLDLSKLPVFEEVPYYKGKLIYFNHNHLNEEGSKVYGAQAAKMLENAINSLSSDPGQRKADAN